MVYLDLSQIIIHPARSGIQRFEREIIRNWTETPPIPCIVDPNGQVRALSTKVLEILCAHEDPGPEARPREQQALVELAREGALVADEAVDRIINLELFFDDIRADAYRRLAEGPTAIRFFVYDFLPFLKPELFAQGTTRHCMNYIRALRAVGDGVAFLSQQTREEFSTRVARRAPPASGWPVFGCGADGLGLERQAFSKDRRLFLCLGTVEQRKNTRSLLEAFTALWTRRKDTELVLAGRPSGEAWFTDFLVDNVSNPNFTFLAEPSDETVRSLMRRARAIVMPSEAEGFGLPPYEAVHCGVPAILSTRIPSAGLLHQGIIKVARADASSLASAVESLLDDKVAERLWQETEGVHLPGWNKVSGDLIRWACRG